MSVTFKPAAINKLYSGGELYILFLWSTVSIFYKKYFLITLMFLYVTHCTISRLHYSFVNSQQLLKILYEI